MSKDFRGVEYNYILACLSVGLVSGKRKVVKSSNLAEVYSVTRVITWRRYFHTSPSKSKVVRH